MRETWYVLENGSVAAPSECAPNSSGRLAHSSGALVAMRSPDVPMTRGVDPATHKTRDVTAEKPMRGYKTRESKAN